ncbi:MAG: YaaC family protein [Tuberibacillus sp.]
MYDQNIWNWFLPFSSTDYTQSFLKKIYEYRGCEEPLSNSYKNGDSFCYYIEHGKSFYKQTKKAPYELKPILLFYGATQLLKACLLIMDPDYPKNASVLAHGVSTRKRKKNRYEFLQDTVQVQKSGLFSYAGKQLFSMESLEEAKLKMFELIHKIPELCPLSERILKQPFCYLVTEMANDAFSVSANILNELHMTKERFFSFLNQYIKPVEDNNPERLSFNIIDQNIFLNDMDGNKYLPAQKHGFLQIPEALVHYLILYNLSMIARYETEWWSVLHLERTSIDLPFIHAFIDITERKFPAMMADWLHPYMEL